MVKSKNFNEMWRMVLDEGELPSFKRMRWLLSYLPSNPRCKICYTPFRGLGAPVMRLIFNKRPSNKNPNICSACDNMARNNPGGAEIELSLLFADVRDSTKLAEGMSPSEFSQLMNRFYSAANKILVDYDAIIDKLVGDEVIGLFVRGLAGQEHAKKAIDAAEKLLEATGNNTNNPWLPIGIGINTGKAFVGSVGSKENFIDFTALGDSVNTTARLASNARAGEILATENILKAAGRNNNLLERRKLNLKGKSKPVNVRVIRLNK
ncbi:adenylate/guanylate cyclase domain-containing protein [Candidatus Woesearchaeota archaeon]|nr:adenylate/guanylate cyclase domain-containing protein [Candidatus Woesearchaeota archaeon]